MFVCLKHAPVSPAQVPTQGPQFITFWIQLEMGRTGTLAQIKGFDAFSKTMEDVKIRTTSGAFITFISAFMISLLLLSEWRDYRRVTIQPELVVDKSRGEKLTINLNITFPRIPCYCEYVA